MAAPAGAHVTSTGLATLSVEGERLTYVLDVVAPEMPEAGGRLLSAAADGDPPMAQALAEAMREAITIEADGTPCRPGRIRFQGTRAGDGKVQLELALACQAPPRRLTIREDWRTLFGEHYQTILSIRAAGASQERILGEGQRTITVEVAGAAPARAGWADFVWLGIEHILGGIDHLLFLVALLAHTRCFWGVVKIVTAFTVAHSITLSLAALGLLAAPGRIVEPLIAASIVWVAVENLISPGRAWRRWLVAFGFGLVHGLGFAGALAELHLDGAALARALVGFNAGLELGQVAFIAVFLPLLAWASRPPALRRLPQLASVLVAAMGTFWFVQRVFFV
ncbi:HupE/UreJ family protein [Vineibacter terrae]|uniref:HupE/UreJ family protein n=1 Tax=Vineibacter terrae TaxID=2586908 RepID=A0A5C8PUW9_9HYPH|nr:HupE/UreJ family protein [Vineibacter terrae]TXL82142.1 HupE/UreJ family protein [Vineibacter terrae]